MCVDADQLQTDIRQALYAQRDAIKPLHLRDLFARQPERFERLSREIPGMVLDFSRQRITEQTLELLTQLADSAQVESKIAALFSGETLNNTEHRRALHPLLRQPADTPVNPALTDEFKAVREVREKMSAFARAVRAGRWRSSTNQTITDVVNVGIGGSYLGAKMVVDALTRPDNDGPRVHFLANIDPARVEHLLAELNPATTLVIVVSKTFTTKETGANIATVRRWWRQALGAEADSQRHFIAVTAHPERARRSGYDEANIFQFWDWVGGRFSLWSAVGLVIAIALGPRVFDQLLAGAHAMDRHFAHTPLCDNLPVLLSVLDIWNTDYLGFTSHAVIPYRDSLRHFPSYLQQLEMESNGKSVQRDGQAVTVTTQPIVWGNVGTDSQHAFFQLLHQGNTVVPADFIVALATETDNPTHQDLLVASCLGQVDALAYGRTPEETAQYLAGQGKATHLLAHQTFPGNRPSTLLALDCFDAHTLGQLLALYEHKVFVSSAIWNINPFDQMGVELGKTLADQMLERLNNNNNTHTATDALISRYQRLAKK